MSLTLLTLWLAAATLASPPGLVEPSCEVWVATPEELSFSRLAHRVAAELGASTSIVLHEWTTADQPNDAGWWVRIAKTRGEWQIAYSSPDGSVELQALPIIDPSTLEADIAGEVALVALTSCSTAPEDLRPTPKGSDSQEPAAPARGRSPSVSRGASLLGASVGLGVLGAAFTALGFGLSFHYYRNFNSTVDDCIFSDSQTSDLQPVQIVQGCRSANDRMLRTNWYLSGIGTAGAVMLSSGLILAIPTAIEFRRARAVRADLRLLGWATPEGAGLGLISRF